MSTLSLAEMRAKFAREALLDLPATATADERQRAEAEAASAQRAYAVAARPYIDRARFSAYSGR